MHDTELSDLSDDADYAASMQQGSASMIRSDSSRRSSVSEPEGAEIVYLKDNVTIHPTQYASERISGRLKLIKQGSSLFLTWIPYKGQGSNARLTEKDKNLYTIRAVPFSDIKSIRRHNPTLGWQYIIIVLSSGLAFPPLYFYNGGVKEFLATVKQHTFLVRSAEDANVFVVNDFQDPLQRTLSSLELPRAVSITNSPSTSIGPNESPSSGNQEMTGSNAFDRSSVSFLDNGKPRTKHNDPARDLSIQVLEKFSLVTRFARETTSQLFREAQMDSFVANERRKHDKPSVGHPQITSSDNAEEVPVKVPVPADPLEKHCSKENHDEEAATIVGTFELIDCKEWATFLDFEGRVLDPEALKKRIFYGGLDHSLRKEVWPFLLGYHAYDSTFAEREYLVSVKRTEYVNVKNQWQVCDEV
ncbi:hypothetical protein M9H77_02145 [Catharanthus roseus]|uniref:Uncharacterized protein n=1 Tax=Catharanthus roseus TaxID=4058 RepID=A0ACC0C7H3_CATRO|nr:hypothetical protein M9H77_02145 [Catharanthus roseus]